MPRMSDYPPVHQAYIGLPVTLVTICLALLVPTAACAQLGAAPSDILIDAASGRVLEADHPDEARFPASLTKMMTLYLTFDALRHRRITLDEPVPVSAHAASREPTKLWLTPRTRITVQQCILGMVTISANDAAAAMGELLGGSETRFAQRMTQQAHRLGMMHTVFRNASGLPDPAQVTTAHDMALLVRALLWDFPQYYHYFSVSSFVFHRRTIYGHDPMLGTYPGVDGLKTGYTSAAGYNLATSAVRNGTRLIGIVLGAPTSPQRSATMVSLLDQGFGENESPVTLVSTAPHLKLPPLVATAQAAQRTVITPSHHPPPKGYTVQVGSFSSHKAALRAVRITVATVGGVAHVSEFHIHGKPMWRGEVASLTRAGAMRVCPAHARRARTCFIVDTHGRHLG